MSLERGDRVVTPTDENAVVLEVDADRAQLRYTGALVTEHAELSLHASLCAKWQRGEPRPRPVRKAFR